MVKQGEIYLDLKYEYELGNTDDKYIIILNKNYKTGDPIIAIPVTTYKNNKIYNKYCNHSSWLFFLPGTEDFFPNDSLLQIYVINNKIDFAIFNEKKNNNTIEWKSNLSQNILSKLLKCIKDLKEDISQDLFDLIFK